jgi:hypothetical protein
MNASVTMRQAGQAEKMAEARLSFEESKTITILIQFFLSLKCVYIFGNLCSCDRLTIYLFIVTGIWKDNIKTNLKK